MPFIISGRKSRRRVLAATLGLAALIATPPRPRRSPTPTTARPQPTLSQTFAPLGDHGLYTPVRNAGLENGATGWTLAGGAAVVAGNEPWKIGGAADGHALDLPAGSSAVTAAALHRRDLPPLPAVRPQRRLAKGSSRSTSSTTTAKGNLSTPSPSTTRRRRPPGSRPARSASTSSGQDDRAAAPVAFRFTPTGKDAAFQIDDVYVDPWARG